MNDVIYLGELDFNALARVLRARTMVRMTYCPGNSSSFRVTLGYGWWRANSGLFLPEPEDPETIRLFCAVEGQCGFLWRETDAWSDDLNRNYLQPYRERLGLLEGDALGVALLIGGVSNRLEGRPLWQGGIEWLRANKLEELRWWRPPREDLLAELEGDQ